jgi:acyl-CoA synthetase (NDP forming)
MLADCSEKGVKTVHLYTARLGETGRQEAIELERKILEEARKRDIRIIGPNCMGIYYPRHGMAFSEELPKESGTLGLVSQSGQATEELARLASLRGVYFNKAVSYGNALDLNECDFLDYFSQDEDSKIILMYIEGVKDGGRFTKALKKAASVKPVIILKGGRGKSGTRAAASHTASLAGSVQVWEAAISQSGAVLVEDLDELIDLTVSFHYLPPIKSDRVGVIAHGGGASVLAADQCEEAGLDVVTLPDEIREELKRRGIPVWDWLGNPADMTIMLGLDFNTDDMLPLMANSNGFDLLITVTGEPFRRVPKLEGRGEKPLLAVLRHSGLGDDDYRDWEQLGGLRRRLIAANVPIYPTIRRAARAARKFIDYYQENTLRGG